MLIIAIDPGKSGGFAYRVSGEIQLRKMPEAKTGKGAKTVIAFGEIHKMFDELIDLADGTENVMVVMEQVGGYVGKQQPGSAMFAFGEGFGFLRGLCMGMGLRLELVTPQAWQKAIGAPVGGDDKKAVLKLLAQQRYPHLNKRGGGITAATCDALLILEYAERWLRP